MHRGYVRWWRKFEDWPWADKPNYVCVFLHLVCMATHKPYRVVFQGIDTELEPGQLITGLLALQKRTGVPKSTIDRILTTLKNGKEIGMVVCNQNRMITINNWPKYQAEWDGEWETDGKRMGTNNNINNNINKKNGKPTKSEIITHWKEMDYKSEPDAFYSYYEMNDWSYKGVPFSDWRDAAHFWETGR